MLDVADCFRQDGDMAQETVEATEDDWQRLAAAVRERRKLLGTQDAAIERAAGRISKSLWSIVENSKQPDGRMAATSLVGVDLGCRWPPGHALDVLRGDAEAIITDDLTWEVGTPPDVIPLLDQAIDVLSLLRGRLGDEASSRPSGSAP